MMRRGLGGQPFFDPFLGDEDLRTAVDRCRAGAWQPLATRLAREQPGRVSWSLLMSDHVDPGNTGLDVWVGSTGSCTALTLRAVGRTRAAWAIRGRARTAEVDPAAWEGFHRGLADAEEDLYAAVAADATDPWPWAALLTTGRGLQAGEHELLERYNQSHRRYPFDPAAVGSYLQGICAKWYGSHDQMFEFARWVYSAAPADSAAQMALPMAHLERAIEQAGIETPTDYFAQPLVAGELAMAADRFLAATPAAPAAAHLGVLNLFALVLAPVHDRAGPLGRQCFERIGNQVTEQPWSYYGQISASFSAVRAERMR